MNKVIEFTVVFGVGVLAFASRDANGRVAISRNLCKQVHAEFSLSTILIWFFIRYSGVISFRYTYMFSKVNY